MTDISIFHLFSFAGGLAIFLYGMQQGEHIIRRIGGARARRIISSLTRRRLVSYCAGLLFTLVTQSSSATTVILVGLVNARVMTLGQSLGMILGSNLGTTFTVQLFAFKFHQVAPLLIAAGFFISLNRKSESAATTGRVLFSAGLIFSGMHAMAEAVSPLRSLPMFESALQSSLSNPWYGLVAGTLITALIQSSAATLTIIIGLTQSMSGQALSPVSLFPLVMGANLGTCVTAFLATFGSDIAGKRVAWSHLLFKLLGIVIIIPFMPLIMHPGSLPFFPCSPAVQVALWHTLFNAAISIVFLPLLSPFERMIERLIRPGHETAQRYHTEYISESIIDLPALALAQAGKEIGLMAEMVRIMVDGSREIIQSYSLRRKTDLAERDNEVDFLHESIIDFLTRMSRGELDAESAALVYRLIMVTTDLEHIGDIVSKSIIILAEKIDSSPLPLSSEGKAEIMDFYDHTITDLKNVLAAFNMNDTNAASAVYERKAINDEQFSRLFNRHMERLFNRKPESLQTTSIHIDLLEEIRRIDHFVFRIAARILKISNTD